MSRYLVFCWCCYEAEGGWNDLRLRTNQIETADEFIDKNVLSSEKEFSWDRGQIVDTEDYTILREEGAS